MDRGRALEDALGETPSFNALEGRDRAFARALVDSGPAPSRRHRHRALEFLDRPLPDNADHARALLHHRRGAIAGARHASARGSRRDRRGREPHEGSARLREADERGAAQGRDQRPSRSCSNSRPAPICRNGSTHAGAPPTAMLRGTYRRSAAEEPPLDISVKDEDGRTAGLGRLAACAFFGGEGAGDA
jgi:hypothetical protein